MKSPAYGSEALRRFLGGQERRDEPAAAGGRGLVGIPPDAEMDGGIILGCWNGERFVSWDRWFATAPIAADPQPPAPAREAPAYGADCGGTKLWLAKDGDRWLLFADSRKARSRRKDFASPFLGHTIRTAEQWYGAASGGWREEKTR